MTATQTLVSDDLQAQKEERRRVNLNRLCLLFPPAFFVFLDLPPVQSAFGLLLVAPLLAMSVAVVPALYACARVSTPRRIKEPAISFVAGCLLMEAMIVLARTFNF